MGLVGQPINGREDEDQTGPVSRLVVGARESNRVEPNRVRSVSRAFLSAADSGGGGSFLFQRLFSLFLPRPLPSSSSRHESEGREGEREGGRPLSAKM